MADSSWNRSGRWILYDVYDVERGADSIFCENTQKSGCLARKKQEDRHE